MPQQSQPKVNVQNNFIKGLITESTALQFPEDACTETFNCVFDITGRVTRRPGFAAEDSFNFFPIVSLFVNEAYTEFVWSSVGGNGSRDFLVQQQGRFIHFYDLSGDNSVSNHKFLFAIDLHAASFLPTGTTFVPAVNPCQYATGRGKLIIVNPANKPLLVTYDPSGNTIVVFPLDLKQRDFLGLDDGLAVNSRPGFIPSALPANNPKHLYNLINQGWYVGGENTQGFLDVKDILAQWEATGRLDSPSNADVPSLYRDTTTVTAGSLPGLSDVLNPAYIGGLSTGNTLAPKGHFILDIFNPDRNGVMAAEGYTVSVTSVTTVSRPSTVAFFTGRVFYAGADSPPHNSNIYFTQIIERDEQYSQCYQKNDPTNEHFTDLLPDDGGVIRIPEVGSIQKLFVFMNSLIVLANNGVWMISGSSQDSFQANDFQIRKISSIGTRSPLSVVDAKGVPHWFGDDGIYTITFDPSFPNAFNVELITTNTIQSFFDAIPAGSRAKVKGIFNLDNRTIQWLYNSTDNGSFDYDHILVYNTISKAFYPWSFARGTNFTTTTRVRGLFYKLTSKKVKYTTSQEPNSFLASSFSYSEIKDLTYKDWVNLNMSTDYLSYFIAGYEIDGETQRYFQPAYVFVFMEEETNASCFMRGIFDFSSNPSTGKWSTKQQAYNSSKSNYKVHVKRLKVRGRGRALQIKFESESGKPFTIIGWSNWNFQNTTP